LQWRNVKSEDNPADIISRGCAHDGLKSNILWWEGPYWTNANEEKWPNNSYRVRINNGEIPKERKSVVMATVSNNEISSFLLNVPIIVIGTLK